MTKTSRDIVAACEAVIRASKTYRATVTVNGVQFDLSELGLCQRNARKAFEAATGNAMPGAACCAGRTYRNLCTVRGLEGRSFTPNWPKLSKWLQPGDFLYFSGGKACGTCGTPVGHVGIWLGDGRMFQNTSRASLGTCDAGPTDDQKSRVLAAFRLLPLAVVEAVAPKVTWHPGDAVRVILQDGERATVLTDEGEFDGQHVMVPVRIVEGLGYEVTPHEEQGKVYVTKA